jgi:hypothetical protein
MSDAIEFYNELTKMSAPELKEYEDAINNDLRITTENYENYLKTGIFNGRLEGIYEDGYSTCLLELFTIRAYMREQGIHIEYGTHSDYMLRILKAKKERGF